jgi:uncharacterized protein (TIGR00375 family)
MIPRVIGEQAPLKGLHLVGTGDILHAGWRKLVNEQLKEAGEGIFEHPNGTKFILQTEVEDKNRIHHLILFPSISKVDEIREIFSKYSSLDSDGRPKISLTGAEIAENCIRADCLIGFAHAFTPYFGLFAKFNSYKECYGDKWRNIHFLELGLSADTNMADRISELHGLTFLSCSDGHSPWPNKLGREFTRFKLSEITFKELGRSIRREEGRGVTLNVKFNPLEGKYHRTRCLNCLTFFDLTDAQSYKWRCPSCRSPIKKGVVDRIQELADLPPGKHPAHRPRCIHIIPLSEIIAIAIGTKQAFSDKVQAIWKRFVSRFGNEINVLINAPIQELAEIEAKTAELIGKFREEEFNYIPGGAGQYGIPIPPGKRAEMNVWRNGKVDRVEVGKDIDITSGQKSLSEFF